jgi:riboflavin kinase/FMN adenylyltransferase
MEWQTGVNKASNKYRGGNADDNFEMIAAIGAFDGFHKGHQALLEKARELARSSDSTWGTVTFYGHPDTLLSSPEFKSLFTADERVILEKFFSVPETRRMEFNEQLALMTPHEFFDHIASEFGVNGVVVGEGFRFGRERMGTTVSLEAECRERGWISEIVPLMKDRDGSPVSSTAIRAAAASGDMARAWEMLGYPYFCFGHVIRGNERGRALGFPTANINVPPNKAAMRGGVYAALVFALGEWYIGAANVGFNPTFGDVGEMRFEVNLLDFEGDLYGRDIIVFMLEHMRDERRFDSPESLKEQITSDAAAIRQIGGNALMTNSALWEQFRKAIQIYVYSPSEYGLASSKF